MEKMEKFWMGWMELPFSLKKEVNVGFEQATSESTIMKVLLIRYKVILDQNVFQNYI